MSITWPFKNITMEAGVSIDPQSDGRVMLNITRNSLTGTNPYRMMIVAEADGPVRSAMLDPRETPTGFIFNNAPLLMGVRQGKYVVHIYNPDLNNHYDEALVGAAVGELRPHVLWSTADGNGVGVGTASKVWGTYDSANIKLGYYPGSIGTVYTSAQANGLQQTVLYLWNDLAFWQSGNLVYSNIMAYKPGKGVYTFIGFQGDPSKGAHGLGTDGTSMVWVQSSEKPPDESPYPVRDIMVSSFTDDPAKLAPKRLRSFPSSYSVIAPLIVGCGYAAYSTEPGKAFVVRLSDGVEWKLPEGGCVAPVSTEWCWDTVYALTCDEVFLRGGNLAETIARVRLDALGPGIPPD